MLNTSLHNPSVKEKQTCEHFIKMCKETCKTEVSEQMLKEFFNSILVGFPVVDMKKSKVL